MASFPGKKIRFESSPFVTEIVLHRERASLGKKLKELVVAEKGIVFLDRGLGKIWKHKIVGFGVPSKQILTLREGESSKDWRLATTLLEVLARKAQEREAPIVVIGGGATTDIGALVASLYRRGAPLALVPTTLLGMVDAAIGGKTAVNLKRGGKLLKNFAGTFYPARETHFWPGWLDTLPERERLSGIGELLKALWLAGEDVPIPALLSWARGKTDADEIWPLVERAVLEKARFVAEDSFDRKGIREALNYGHTLGHAFEAMAKGKLTHGEAVAWGMWAESAFLAPKSSFTERVRARINALGLPEPKFLAGASPGEFAGLLKGDKKLRGGKIRMSVLRDFGNIERIEPAPHDLAKFAAGLWHKN
jgi:3-dehydroquinate synthase